MKNIKKLNEEIFCLESPGNFFGSRILVIGLSGYWKRWFFFFPCNAWKHWQPDAVNCSHLGMAFNWKNLWKISGFYSGTLPPKGGKKKIVVSSIFQKFLWWSGGKFFFQKKISMGYRNSSNTQVLYYLTRAVYSPASDPVKPVVTGFVPDFVSWFVRACTENLVNRFWCNYCGCLLPWSSCACLIMKKIYDPLHSF